MHFGCIVATKTTQKNMPKVTTYIREDYVKRDGTCAVNCMFYLARQRVVIPTGVSVVAKQWDENKERVKGTSKEAKDANLIIQNTKASINNIFVRFRLEQRTLTKNSFIKEFTDGTIYIDFWDFFEKELDKRRGLLASNTYRAQESTLRKFREILPGLQFKDLTDETIRNIRKILAAKKYGNSQNTITKNLITLKTYVSIAVRKRLIEDNPFAIEKIKRYKPNQVWLTENELRKLMEAYSKKLFPKNLHHVLEYFLFAAFTGMRLSDVKNFTMDQVKGDFIILNPVKTKRTSNEMITIPITSPIKRILNDVAKHRVYGKVFECYADPVTNRMLKRLADGVGVNKEITFHSARHTFATVFLEKTDDLATLQKLLGHSDIKQTMVYVHLTETKKVMQMNKVWEDIMF